MSTETTLPGLGPDETMDAVGLEPPIASDPVEQDPPTGASGIDLTVDIATGGSTADSPRVDLVFETWDASSDLFVFDLPEQPQPQPQTLTLTQDDVAASSDGTAVAEPQQVEPAEAPASAALPPEAEAEAGDDATDPATPAPVDSGAEPPPAEAEDTPDDKPLPADDTSDSAVVIDDDQGGGDQGGGDQGGGDPTVDDGDLILTIMPVGIPEPVLPFEPVICICPMPPEVPPIYVICPGPLEGVGTLYYTELLSAPETSSGFTDASIPAALAI
jgi:hypothetical protein